MLAGDNEYLQEAAESLYVANADEIVRQQCRAREDAERRERTILRDKKMLAEALEQKESEFVNVKIELEKRDNELLERDEYIAILEAKIKNAGLE